MPSALHLQLDPRSGVPAYRQLMDQVKYYVAGGTLRPGDQLLRSRNRRSAVPRGNWRWRLRNWASPVVGWCRWSAKNWRRSKSPRPTRRTNPSNSPLFPVDDDADERWPMDFTAWKRRSQPGT